MKKLLLTILFICSSFAPSLAIEEIQNAIENEEHENVKTFLSMREISQPQKDLLLGIARQKVAERNNKLSLFSSGSDALRLATGPLLLAVGIPMFGTGVFTSCTVGLMIFPLPLTLLLTYAGYKTSQYGLNQMSHGWNLKSAHARLQNTRDIVDALVKKPVTD